MMMRPSEPQRVPADIADAADVQIGAISFVLHRDPDPQWSIRNLVNDRYDIIAFALSGTAEYQCDRKNISVKKGHLLFFPKGVVHTGISNRSNPWSFVSTAFDIQCESQKSLELIRNLPFHLPPPHEVPVDSLMLELENIWSRREPGYMLRCRSILMHLLYILMRFERQSSATVPHARQMAAVVEFLQQNYTQTYSIDFLSEMANLSPSRFRTIFKRYTGYSANRYQNWIRINKACDMLRTGEFTVTRAARAVGIDDIYYFSRLFKKLIGLNPSDYRLNG